MSDFIEGAHVRVIPQDPNLPWLATALDPEAMALHFTRSVLPAFHPGEPARFALRHCDIDHVRYRPGRNCAIAYRLQVLDKATSQQHDLLFHGRMYPPTGAISRHTKAGRQRLEQPPLGPPLHLLAPLDMVLWAFPNERKLHGLGSILDDARLTQEVLPEVIARGWGSEWKVTQCQREVVHYVPEHTLTLRVTLELRHARTGENLPATLYGKCYYDGQGWRTWQTMNRLRRHGASGLRTPAPICYQARHRLLWQEAMPGAPLADLLHDELAADTLFTAAGAQIRALHRTPIATKSVLSYASLVEKITGVERLLATQLGNASHLAVALGQRLRDTLPGEWPSPVLLHGDLHAKNFLVDGAALALIDLDSCIIGPAAWDLGSFIAAQLCVDLTDEGAARARRQTRSLLDGYDYPAEDREARHALHWSIACALLIERAYRSVSRLKAGRIAHLPAVLSLASRVLGGKWMEVA